MPKADFNQSNFSGGEFSPMVQGRTDSERYRTGLAACYNWIPTLQGPLLRRPGTKYLTTVKDKTKPPILVEFQFSITKNYVFEFGDQYIRFYTNLGQKVTSGTTYKVSGTDSYYGVKAFYALRSSTAPNSGETVLSSTSVTTGSIMELQSPYSWAATGSGLELGLLKFVQKEDTIYIFHPSYPPYKLQRNSENFWTIKQVAFRDGPYMELNSYSSLGDSTTVTLTPNTTGNEFTLTTGPTNTVSGCANNGSGAIRVTTAAAHNHNTGDRVVILGVVGTTEANNTTLSVSAMSWTITVIDATHFDLIGSTFTNAYVSGGTVYPALFQPGQVPGQWYDVGRTIRVVQAGVAYWGIILVVNDMRQVLVKLDSSTPSLPATTAINTWYLGVLWFIAGYPAAGTFHQDRLFMVGITNRPQEIDGSVTGDHENFQPSNPATLTVADNNALQFNLNSSELNALYWAKSSPQGLLVGSRSSEWSIMASSQGQALTPTNFNANETSGYGSTNVDAVKAGNAVLYVQRSAKKVRELNYFFQVGTFRSTDLSELAGKTLLPGVSKLVVQRETYPLLWAVKTDGNMATMTYDRDDITLHAGWARHQLGGQSDAGGTNPIVLSAAVIPDPTQTFDQLWLVVQRWINGVQQVCIEYMAQVFDDSMIQEDAYHFDCGATYDSPITITGISSANPGVVTTSAAHGLTAGNMVRIVNVIGLNKTTVDQDGNSTTTNLVNENTFTVGTVGSSTTFNLLDANGNNVDTTQWSAYVSGGQLRKLITTISGVTWLENETVGVWADGAPHPPVTVSNSGVLTLNYPAAKVQFGYDYNSDFQLLRPDVGSATGSTLGKLRRVGRVAVQLYRAAQIQMGMAFTRLLPIQYLYSDNQQADQAPPLYSGVHRDGVESFTDFDGMVCFRANQGAPASILAVNPMLEEQDV